MMITTRSVLCFQMLLQHGALIEARDDTGRTPLYTAVQHGNPNCMKARF